MQQSTLPSPEELEARRLGLLEGWLSTGLNTALFAVKYWIGTQIGSVAMVADAWHTLSDTVTSVVVIVGFWIAARPGDREHPFGHGRAELLASVVIGTLLAVVGVNFFRDSWLRLQQHRAVTYTILSMVVFGGSFLIKEALAQFSMWAGRKVGSRSLIADGWHHRSDAIASVLIVAGAVFGSSLWWIDGVLGIGVALLILWAAFAIVWGAAQTFMGESASADLDRKIQQVIARETPEATTVHHIHVHRYGFHIEVTLHVRLPDHYPVDKAHALVSILERALRKDLGVEPTIHVEPASEEPPAPGAGDPG